jgi:4'-phosphopantetheinyl transferase
MPAAERDEVHVWCASLVAAGRDMAAMEVCLSPDEHRRAGAFHFEDDRRRLVVRRAVLRALLGRYLAVQPDQVAFTYGPNGKPTLDPSFVSARLHFNASHSNDLALFAVASDREVGVDLEWIRPMADMLSIAEHHFSNAEQATLISANPAERLETFFSCWTRKEAFVKATGEGLSRPLDAIDVSIVRGWSVRHLVPAPNFTGAVAAAGEGWTLRCWQWEAAST